TIRQAWARVAADPGQGPGIVVITGEAGTGKSRLVAEALGVLRPAPAVLLAGTARAWAPAPYDWLTSTQSNVPGPPPLPPVPRPRGACPAGARKRTGPGRAAADRPGHRTVGARRRPRHAGGGGSPRSRSGEPHPDRRSGPRGGVARTADRDQSRAGRGRVSW